MTEPKMTNSQTLPPVVWVAVATGFAASMVAGIPIGLSPFVAVGVGIGVGTLVPGVWNTIRLFKRVALLEADQRRLQDGLPEHLAAYDAAIERLSAAGGSVRQRVERIELRLLRPDLRELTELATEQGWEWWRSSDVVRFASPSGIELTFELPVQDGERRLEIARQLEGFGLKWSAEPTRIAAQKNKRAPGPRERSRG